MLNNTQVEKVFNSSFSVCYNTILTGGFNEPEYIPSTKEHPAFIQYRADFVRSALHEVAHWCLAGEKRRQLHDYDYWYSSQDRGQVQQQKFFEVEVKPQALEWIFSSAAGVDFKPSADNLSLDQSSMYEMQNNFVAQIKGQTINYLKGELLKGDLAQRALVFIAALQDASGELLVSKSEVERAEL